MTVHCELSWPCATLMGVLIFILLFCRAHNFHGSGSASSASFLFVVDKKMVMLDIL